MPTAQDLEDQAASAREEGNDKAEGLEKAAEAQRTADEEAEDVGAGDDE